ncbi:hypothetical protein [Acidovorax sp.]|uniref:hypothetical protein n=1 Tax=Acidovorax sp. TaxID=1872122 RepID=UPI0025BCAB7B|nr:hypothetical protein [Acidovorax sp.]
MDRTITNETERFRIRFDDLIRDESERYPSSRYVHYNLQHQQFWIAKDDQDQLVLVNQFDQYPISELLGRKPMGLALQVEKGLRLVGGQRMKAEEYIALWRTAPVLTTDQARARGIQLVMTADRVLDKALAAAQSEAETALIQSYGPFEASDSGLVEFKVDLSHFEGHVLMNMLRFAWGESGRSAPVTRIVLSPPAGKPVEAPQVPMQVDWTQELEALV